MALVISVIAMATSIYEANIMKSQQKAMVWPYIELTERSNAHGFGVEVANKGTGPAIITSVQIDHKGRPVENIDVLLDSLNPDRTFGYDLLRNSTIGNQVFMSGEKREVFGLPYNDETRIIRDNLLKHVRMRVAYRSVLDEHWLYDSEKRSNSRSKFKAKKEFKN